MNADLGQEYIIVPMHNDHLDSVVAIHLKMFPQTLMSRVGEWMVRGYYQALLQDTGNFVGLVAHPVGSQKVAAYCLGLLDNSRHLERYLWGLDRRRTLLRLMVAVLRSPDLWRPAIIQIIGLARDAYRRLRYSNNCPQQRVGESGVAVLMDIACAPEHQGKGLATRLLSAWEEAMVRAGAEVLLLMVRADNESAIRLYQRAGWTIKRAMDNLQQPGYVMTKRLK